MIGTPHMVAGAATALGVSSAPVALALGVLSHGVLDTIPHTDYSPYPLSGLAVLDLTVGLCLVGALVRRDSVLWAGAIGGALPDVFAFVERHLDLRLTLPLHGWVHTKIVPEFWAGLYTQMGMIALATTVLFLVRRRRAKTLLCAAETPPVLPWR